MALESEREHSDIMNRPPRNPAVRLFEGKTIASGLSQGAVLFLVSVTAFLISLYRGQGALDARAVSFTTLVLGNLALIWTNRSRTRTIFEVLGSPNIAVWAITAGTILFLGATLYVPWARDLFQFSILHPDDVAMCVLLALASVTWFEAAKVLRRAKPWARS